MGRTGRESGSRGRRETRSGRKKDQEEEKDHEQEECGGAGVDFQPRVGGRCVTPMLP